MSQRISFNARTPWERATPTGLHKIKPRGSHYSLLAFNNSAFIRGLSVCALRPRVCLNLFPGIYLREDTRAHIATLTCSENEKQFERRPGWPRQGLCFTGATERSQKHHRSTTGGGVRLHNPLTLTLIRTVTLFYRPHRLPNRKELSDYTDRSDWAVGRKKKKATATNLQHHGQRLGFIINTQRN